MKLKQQRSGSTPLLYISLTGIAKAFFILLLSFSSIAFVEAQKQDYIWCFGDSAGIDFNSGGPIPFQSGMQAHEAAASISDQNGNLLFYAGDKNFSTQYSSVRNLNHQIMFNGDSLLSAGSVTNGLMIVPFPNEPTKFYLFHRSYPPGLLYYSIIDMSLQSGIGEVVQKNILIIGNTNLTERIAAVKHANGRDWWIITHTFGNDEFQLLLVSPQGIAGPYSQNIGNVYSNFLSIAGEIATSIEGNKLAIATHSGIIDVFDFDRCTGMLSNWQSIGPTTPSLPLNTYYGCEFSSGGNLLYVTTIIPPYSQLLQYDLLSANPMTPYYIYANTNDSVSFGQLQRSPDGKVYMANVYNPNWTNTTYDSLNMYLGVINEPDSIGLACNFSPYSVYLGGRRSFYSLPNLPNYNLGELVGSLCDTLTSINPVIAMEKHFEIVPNPVSNYFKISVEDAMEASYNFNLQIFNSNGKLVFENINYLKDEYINGNELSSGIYAITLTQNSKQWYGKFIKL